MHENPFKGLQGAKVGVGIRRYGPLIDAHESGDLWR